MKQNNPQTSPFEEAMKQIAKAPKKEVVKAMLEEKDAINTLKYFEVKVDDEKTIVELHYYGNHSYKAWLCDPNEARKFRANGFAVTDGEIIKAEGNLKNGYAKRIWEQIKDRLDNPDDTKQKK